MKMGDIYRRLQAGEDLHADRFAAMAAIDHLARLERVAVDGLDMSASQFARAYPRQTPPEGFGGATFNTWRATVLNLQMRAAPTDTDGDPWASLRRAARLSSAPDKANTLSQLSCRLPAEMRPWEISSAVLRAASAKVLGAENHWFRGGVFAFLALFDMPLAVQTGLLPAVIPEMPPSVSDHRAHAPLAPEIARLRQRMADGLGYECSIDYINRLAVAAGLLNGISDSEADLMVAIANLPDELLPVSWTAC